MTLTPPYYLLGQAGAALGAGPVALSELGATGATLILRSLDADELVFTLWDNGSRPAIPDHNQWVTLMDDAGQVLITGMAKRSFLYPQKIYSYTVLNVYQAMRDTQITSQARPYITYFSDELSVIVRDIIQRAGAAGIPIKPPAADEMAVFFTAPKMSFRGTSYAAALEDSLKWVPDVTTRVDYSTTPATLRFYSRTDTASITLDLDSSASPVVGISLEPMTEMHALGISFSYSKRAGDTSSALLVQSAGDPNAEGVRLRSLFISGAERMDAFLAEALTTALDAKAMAKGLGASSTIVTPSLPYSWETCLAASEALQGAVAAEAGFKMAVEFPTGKLYDGFVYEYNNEVDTFEWRSNNYATLHVTTSNGSAMPGWFAVKPDEFTDEDLQAAGALKNNLYLSGSLYWFTATKPLASAGITYLFNNYVDKRVYVDHSGGISFWFKVKVPCIAINKPPSMVAAIVAANNADSTANFVTRADYVDIPDDLAQNYFARQDWTPYKGSIEFMSGAPNIPVPGDFINAIASDAPAEWATMKTPVHETIIDLASSAATVNVGPSSRMENIADRLRIPAEDNYQAG